MPHVRGKKKPESNVPVSLMQAPCLLGLQKKTPAPDRGAVYSLTAEAASIVEALALSSAVIEARAPELKSRFLDRFADCLKQEATLLDACTARIRVSTGSTSLRQRGVEAKQRRSEREAPDGRQQGALPSIGSSSGQTPWDAARTRTSLQAAAADLGSKLRPCLGAGATRRSYRVTAQCSSCLRLMHPEDAGVCEKCGCASVGWQPKIGSMSADADSTIQHLQVGK